MPSSILVLTGKDVAELLESPSTIRSALESQSRAFKAYSSSNRQGFIQAPLRTTLTSNDVTTLVMPARADAKLDLGGIGIKVVSVPNQGNAGLPATTTIFDETTGNLRAVINARALTALRNACGSTLYLQTIFNDPSDRPKHIVFFGSGAQIRAHAALFKTFFPSISSMTIINRRKTDRLDQLGNELRALFTNSKDSKIRAEVEVDIVLGVNGEEGFDQERVLEKADVIVTATPSTESLFPSSAIPSREGSYSGSNDDENIDKKRNKTAIVLIGSYKPHMREIDADLVNRALRSGGKITCDSREACLTEAGELQDVRPDQTVELGEILNTQDGRAESVRPDGGEVNIYKSVGIAVQDVAVANAMIEAAKGLGVGTVIEDYD
ncbi:hypothetical protein FFLO_02871 [Filobasidium floriforme]|uniref:Ornithine cyclodeaminase n=1 Tax=Filobasidium floriforme TaxID=5210 RepID=A0A8K0JM77_9TREE|nr:uncharacterized protein HD553DRAFT_179224 [Filobasidium floriforme]KAG7558218.1 hypothetical protein FFLO_02871 [Filobasidium floriforme]KAH8088511.1 hypothetical protein HD553DRAFT_179224 [Filobasidium floriforme]